MSLSRISRIKERISIQLGIKLALCCFSFNSNMEEKREQLKDMAESFLIILFG